MTATAARRKPDGRVLCWRPTCRGVLARLLLFEGKPVLRLEAGWSRDPAGVLYRRREIRRRAVYLDPRTLRPDGWTMPRYLDGNHSVVMRWPRCSSDSAVT